MGNIAEIYVKRLEENIAVHEKGRKLASDVEKGANAIVACLKKGGKILLFGNGGSTADAQHIAAELLGKFKMERKALPAIALTTNSSVMTAIANDYGYEKIFSRQVEGLAKKGDVVIGISTSGNSESVVLGLKKAKEMGAFCIGMSGERKAKIDEVSDICLKVPSTDTARIQEMHIFIGHVICELAEKETA